MMNIRKASGRASSMPAGLACGALVSILATLILTALIAKLLQTGALAQEQVGYAAMILLLIASFSGAITAQGKVKHRRGLVSMLSGMVYFLILVSITALFFGGQYSGFWATGMLVLGGAASAALLSGNRAGKHRKKRFPSVS